MYPKGRLRVPLLKTRFERKVRKDNRVSLVNQVYQLPWPKRGRTMAGRKIEMRVCLDGAGEQRGAGHRLDSVAVDGASYSIEHDESGRITTALDHTLASALARASLYLVHPWTRTTNKAALSRPTTETTRALKPTLRLWHPASLYLVRPWTPTMRWAKLPQYLMGMQI